MSPRSLDPKVRGSASDLADDSEASVERVRLEASQPAKIKISNTHHTVDFEGFIGCSKPQFAGCCRSLSRNLTSCLRGDPRPETPNPKPEIRNLETRDPRPESQKQPSNILNFEDFHVGHPPQLKMLECFNSDWSWLRLGDGERGSPEFAKFGNWGGEGELTGVC